MKMSANSIIGRPETNAASLAAVISAAPVLRFVAPCLREFQSSRHHPDSSSVAQAANQPDVLRWEKESPPWSLSLFRTTVMSWKPRSCGHRQTRPNWRVSSKHPKRRISLASDPRLHLVTSLHNAFTEKHMSARTHRTKYANPPK